MSRTVSAEEAVSVVKSGDRASSSTASPPPRSGSSTRSRRAPRSCASWRSSRSTPRGRAPYAAPEHAKSFRVNALFVGANVRKAVEEGRADYLPVFLSDVPQLFRTGVLPLDVALVHVSPPGPARLLLARACRWT